MARLGLNPCPLCSPQGREIFKALGFTYLWLGSWGPSQIEPKHTFQICTILVFSLDIHLPMEVNQTVIKSYVNLFICSSVHPFLPPTLFHSLPLCPISLAICSSIHR